MRCTSSPVCCFKPKPSSEPQNILFYTSPYFTSWQGSVGARKFSPFGPEFPVGPDSPPSQARVSAPSRVSLICMGRAGVFFKNSPSAPDPILHSDTPSRCRRRLGLPLLQPRFPTAVLRLARWFSHPGTSPPLSFRQCRPIMPQISIIGFTFFSWWFRAYDLVTLVVELHIKMHV